MTIKVFNVACDKGHLFEGWFSSSADFEKQKKAKLIACPMCGSTDVQKRPSASYIKGAPPAKEMEKLTRRVMAYVRDVAAKADDVGEKFPQEARAIHAGKAPQRMIRGHCSIKEAEELLDEGISLLPIPESTGKTLN